MLIVYILRCFVYRACITWHDVCCICFVGDISSKMDSTTNAVKDECLPVEETDNPYGFKIVSVVSLAGDTDSFCTTECVNRDCSVQVKQENLSVVKKEPDNVCCIVLILL